MRHVASAGREFAILFQSTHLVWGATYDDFLHLSSSHISIHAPRVRCDRMSGLDSVIGVHFNPRTSCEVRRKHTCGDNRHDRFQSTHLVWGATAHRANQNGVFSISIHAPRVRCDNQERARGPTDYLFQSTHLVWGATAVVASAARKESYFNPRTSCEVRLISKVLIVCGQEFQSTHLVWGATISYLHDILRKIHFNPRTSCEVRHRRLPVRQLWLIFQSTHLVWGATATPMVGPRVVYISIHAPRVRCDITSYFKRRNIIIFQSTHLVWGATMLYYQEMKNALISIHAPRVRCDVEPL